MTPEERVAAHEQVSRATDKIAEEMAREILKDPAFRQEMQAAIGRAFTDTIVQLRKRRRKKRA